MEKLSGSFELDPAYGRDYKNKADVEKAFREGKDFMGDWQCGFKPIGISDFSAGTTIILRYRQNRAVHVIKV